MRDTMLSTWIPSCAGPTAAGCEIKETLTPNGSRIGIRVDITDLKRSEESFRIILEKNPIPMWVFDHESLRFLTVNEAAAAHYGYSKDQFLTMTVLDIRRPEYREKLLEHVPAGKNVNYRAGRVWRHLKADGTEIEVAIYANALEFEGRSASIVAAVDVTEQLAGGAAGSPIMRVTTR